MSHKIILNADDSVTCPHCDEQFSLQDGLTHQLIEQYEIILGIKKETKKEEKEEGEVAVDIRKEDTEILEHFKQKENLKI